MTTIDVEPEVELEEDFEEEMGYAPYRALSKGAVFSLVLTLLALLGLLFPLLLVFAALAVLLGVIARRNLKRYPNELTGRIPAFLGTFGGLLVLVGGIGMHTYIYFTEVPDGYTRITYSQLQPKGVQPDTKMPLLPDHLDGKRVFVKGYVHPSVGSVGGVTKFILVPDMGTCCFGGQPERLTDMIEVTLVNNPKGIRYSTRKRKLAGTFKVNHTIRQVTGGLTGGFYELKADYVK